MNPPAMRTDKADANESVRFDVSRVNLSRAKRTPQGFLVAPAFATRVGIFEYKTTDGHVRREYRPADEVFHEDSLATLTGAPLTRGHPSEDGKPVTIDPTNARKHSIGWVSSAPQRVDGKVGVDMTIMDAEVIADAGTGKIKDASCGYSMVLDETPGVHPKYGRYDAIQRRIRYNHVALLGRDEGRAGPDIGLRLDARSAVVYHPDEDRSDTKETGSMDKEIVTIGGVEFEVPKAAAQAIREDAKRREAQLATGTKEKETLQARLDAKEAELVKAKADLATASDVVRFDSAVQARVDLMEQARKAWKDVPAKGADGKALDERGIRETVLKHAGIDTANRSDAYVEARFDALIETLGESDLDDSRVAGKRAAAGDTDRADADDVQDDDDRRDSKNADDAYQRMVKRSATAWETQKLQASK